ncbi:MAG TPA: 3-phosphoshikimate 1-carboxyvinyltransferase, partial [Candidatus Polarisedimenticolia bacterium]|nr:3-phosphoshikimate 1-carboxyvinyltransferase [Candidatus Polarisedimenticolia bacterium]
MMARPIGAVRTVRARLTAPPSKSVTQRALLIASLCPGRSRLLRPLLGEDGLLLRDALAACGAGIVACGAEAADLEVQGGEAARNAGTALMLGNAGTAMRFLAARLAVEPDPRLLDGGPRMRQRPIEDLLGALRGLGMEAESVRGNGCPPIRVGGGRPRGGAVTLSGARSSQFVSALLMAAPRLEQGIDVGIEGALVSQPYVDLTASVMRRFGVEVRRMPERFAVAPGQAYHAAEVAIEGDWSSASYLFAAAAIVPGRVEVEGLDPGSSQGDAGILELLRRMGCRVEANAGRSPDGGKVTVEGPDRLRAVEADLAGMPDLAPTVAVLALFADGASRIRGVPHLRLKESDRLAALAAGIVALGGEAETHEDGLTIRPRPL